MDESISLREKININRYAPVEWGLKNINSFIFGKNYNPFGAIIRENLYQYERVSVILKKDSNSIIDSRIMETFCGRVQAREMIRKGIFDEQKYLNLKKIHKLSLSKSLGK